jgi:hypothetical protein
MNYLGKLVKVAAMYYFGKFLKAEAMVNFKKLLKVAARGLPGQTSQMSFHGLP